MIDGLQTLKAQMEGTDVVSGKLTRAQRSTKLNEVTDAQERVLEAMDHYLEALLAIRNRPDGISAAGIAARGIELGDEALGLER